MPDNEIAVSIIVSARDAQKHLPRCLQSLQKQTLQERMEVIVVDSGSNDRTYETALEFHAAEPDFVRVHRLNSADAFRAEQTGLALARGKYVAFCDADATAPPELYHTLYEYCEKNSADHAGLKIWERTLRALARRDFLLAHGLPVKTGCVRDEQLVAYGTLRALISPEELPLFCSDWMDILRGVCLREYRENRGGAAFYRQMISLADEPQVTEAMAHADRDALDRAHRKFYAAFRARDWIKLEKQMRRLKIIQFSRCDRG